MIFTMQAHKLKLRNIENKIFEVSQLFYNITPKDIPARDTKEKYIANAEKTKNASSINVSL